MVIYKKNEIKLYIFNSLLSLFLMSYMYSIENLTTLKVITVFLLIISFLYKLIIDRGLYYSLWYAFPSGFLFFIVPELFYYSGVYYDEYVFTAAKLICISGIGIIYSSLTVRGEFQDYTQNKANINVSNYQLILVLILFFVYLILVLPSALLSLSIGRSAANEISGIGSFGLFIDSLAYILPTLFLVLYRSQKVKFWVVIISLVLVVSIQVMIGVRYKIIFTVCIFSLTYLDLRNISLKYILFAIWSMIFLSFFTWAIRGSGLDNFYENVSNISSQTNVQQIFYYFAGVIQYYENIEHSYFPKYSLFSLYALFPRSIWEGKPEMLGSWILDTGYFVEYFSNGHSGSVSFIGPLFADFGFSSLLVVFLIGALFIYIDKLSYKYTGRYSFLGITFSALFPTIFFSVRSLNTSLINFYIMLIVLFVYFCLARFKVR